MKPKLKQYLKITAIFISGLAVGIFIMGYLSVRASKTYLDAFNSVYYIEQMDLAEDAHNKGNKYAEFVYRNNIVDSSFMGKLKVYDKMKTTWTFGFPFAAPILDKITAHSHTKEVQQSSYALELGRLAEATENIGLKEEAEKLWRESASLMRYNDVNRVRSLVATMHKSEAETNSKSENK